MYLYTGHWPIVGRDYAFQWTDPRHLVYTIHMKRTNLMLDPHLLEEATRVLRVKTYSAAVNTALEEVLRVRRIQRLPEFFGTKLWEGNLREMREDPPNGHRDRRHRSSE